MTIFLTTQSNDADLIPLLQPLVTPYPIPFGDFNFSGKWTNQEQVWIWGDRKKLGDLVTCVVSTGRLLRQVQDAKAAGFRFFFVIIEAVFRCNPDTGNLQHLRGKKWVDYHLNPKNPDSPTIPYIQIINYLNQLDWYCGVRVRITSNARETAQAVKDIYHLFQQAPEDHSSLKQFETHHDPHAAYLYKPSLTRRIAKEFDKVGWDRSLGFDKEFNTTGEMLKVIGEGDVKRLMKVNKVGKGIAQSMIEEVSKS